MDYKDFTRDYSKEAKEIYEDSNKTTEEKTAEIKKLTEDILKETRELKSLMKEIYTSKGYSEEEIEKMFERLNKLPSLFLKGQ